jgi:AcrR family transcriptional regulator
MSPRAPHRSPVRARVPAPAKAAATAPAKAAPDLRSRILAASVALLETEGLAAMSMREVARRAGVTHQAPYHHFADRESILAELVTDGFTELTRRLARANDRAPRLGRRVALVEAGLAYVGFALDHPGVFGIMFRPEVVDLCRFEAASQAGESAYGELSRLVSIVHGEDAPALASMHWSVVHGLACLIVDGGLGDRLPGSRERRAHVRETLERFAGFIVDGPARPPA